MHDDGFDPLGQNLQPELIAATLKRQIKNILKSYTGWYDPFAELIQNALDGVDNRKAIEKDYKPQIWITIDLKENQICVTDNGIGLQKDQFESFLAPNVSFKKNDNRGNKGVGATYLAYGFNSLQVGTITPEYSYVGTIRGGREWVEDDSGIKTRPLVYGSKPIHEIFNKIDRGATFVLKLCGEYIRPKDLDWFGATMANQWEAILRIKTALGGIYIQRIYTSPICHLSIVDKNGNVADSEITDCSYIYPHTVISACKGLNDIRSAQQEQLEKGKDASKIPDSFYKLNGIYNSWSIDDLEKGLFKMELDSKQKMLLKNYGIRWYGYFCYSTKIWDRYSDDLLKLRQGTRILRGGLQLACNFMPQGELITIPLTRNVQYQTTTHIIIHFQKADPDLGRKGFQPELEDLAKLIAAASVRHFQNFVKFLKKDTGVPPDIQESKNIHDWKIQQENHERDNPLIITRTDIFLPLKQASITSKPLNEQDVIALFNQLLAGGVIRGIRLLSSSQHEQYDGVFRLILEPPIENYIYDGKSNPLGLDENAAKEYRSEPRILEYKFNFDALIEEFGKEEKNPKHIDLAITWEMGNYWRGKYEITSLLDLDNMHHREFHGQTHLLKDAVTGARVFPMIVLSELIDYINNPDNVQDFHRRNYGE